MALKIQKASGLTLTELVVATILMGIIMIAVAAVDVSLRSSYQSTSKDVQVAMRVSAAMLHITNNITSATGMRTDPGIITDPAIPPDAFILIRHDVNDPASYADDTWMYYSYLAADRNITFCSETPDGGGTCTGDQYIVSVAESFSVDFDPDENLRNLYVTVSISSLYDNSQPFHEMDNPRTSLTSRILPLQHTW